MDFKKPATEILAKYLEEWESDPIRMRSGYDYELSYAVMIKKFEKELLQLSVGKIPKSKNSKKTPNPIWKDSPLQEPCTISSPRLYGY